MAQGSSVFMIHMASSPQTGIFRISRREGWAIKELQDCAGTQIDSSVVNAFVEILNEQEKHKHWEQN